MISIDIHYLDDLIRNPCHHLLIQGQWLSIVACGQFELSIPIGQKPLWLLRSKDGFNENEYSFPRSRETSPGRGLLKKTHDSYIYIYKSWSNNVLSCHICKLISWFDVLGVIENKTSNLSLWHLQSRDFRNETLWHHYETLSADHIDPTHLPAVPGRTSSDWIPRR